MRHKAICKTVHQYSRGAIPKENMLRLLEIADDCRKVKNCVYSRYGGSDSLTKIYPGYSVQKEMNRDTLRKELGLPSVYFNLAVLDALTDIKGQWVKMKKEVLRRVNRDENFLEEERHYLRFALLAGDVFEAVLNQKTGKMVSGADMSGQKKDIWNTYGELTKGVNATKLDSYLHRQVQELHVVPHTDVAKGFSISERAYRYGEHGIYITVKEKRKRIFVPLTDNNRYTRQIYIKLYPESGNVELKVPVDVRVKQHRDYVNQVGVAMGMYTMFTTDRGHMYGEELGELQIGYAEWIREQAVKHAQDKGSNPGRKNMRVESIEWKSEFIVTLIWSLTGF